MTVPSTSSVGPGSFAGAHQIVRDIDGWLAPSQARMLYDAAGLVRPGSAVVEIGSHHGKSTIMLASAMPEGTRLLAVDPFDDPRWGGGAETLESFAANVDRAGLADTIDLYRGISEDAARGYEGPSIGLLYVDGAHDYASVLKDIDLWLPHLAPGASILFHDAFSSRGVTHALVSRLFFNDDFDYVRAARSLVWFTKEPVSGAKRARKLARLGTRMTYFGRNLAVKVAIRRNQPWALKLLRHDDTAMPY